MLAEDTDELMSILIHPSATPSLQSLTSLQEVCSFWRDTIRSQLDTLLFIQGDRAPVMVGEISKLLAINHADVIQLLQKPVAGLTVTMRLYIALDPAEVRTVFMHDWSAVKQVADQLKQVADQLATNKRAREVAAAAAAYKRYGGGGSSSAAASRRSMRGRSMSHLAEEEAVEEEEHVGSAAPVGSAAGCVTALVKPGQLSDEKSTATLAALAAWKQRLSTRSVRLLEMGFRSERVGGFIEGGEVADANSGRVYIVKLIDVDGRKLSVGEVPAEPIYGGDGLNDARFGADRNRDKLVAFGPSRLVVLRPPSGLMLIPIVNTLARVFRDQQASKFKPTEAELLSSLAAWPETGNVRGKICEKPCGIEWTVTPSACSWGAIYSESAAAIIPTVRRRDDEWYAYTPEPIHRDEWREGAGLNRLSGTRSWKAELVVEDKTPKEVVEAYVAACAHGAETFRLEWSHAFSLEPNRAPPVCYGGDARIVLADGTIKLARELAVGDEVGVGERVTAVWRASVGRRMEMVCMGGAVLTPDHPVDHPDASRGWVRADALRAPVALYVDAIFNFVLSGPTRSLVLEVEAGNVLIASTLGQHVPAFPEPFWGTEAVVEQMKAMPAWPLVQTSC
jgi:hypothetical protein